MDIKKILAYGWPGAKWSCGPSYESLQWFGPGVKPTLEEVLAAELPAEKAARIARIKEEARARCYAAVSLEHQLSALWGRYSQAKKDGYKAAIDAIGADSDTAEAAVNALTTVAEVQGFVL